MFRSSARFIHILSNRVGRYLIKQCGISSPPAPLLLSVSGGCDSMALLHIICDIFEDRSALEVIHFNHMVRKESVREEEFVRYWAGFYGLKIHVFELPQEERAGSGFQDRSRAWRRQLSKSTYSQLGDDDSTKTLKGGVLLGHHADDQVETLLLKLCRGVHLSHLRPMLPRDGIFVRPLLGFHKHELEKYLLQRDFPWCEDPSNKTKAYTRNRLRLDAVPALADAAGGIEALSRRVAAIAEESCALREWIDREIDHYEKCNPSALRRRGGCQISITLSEAFYSLSPLVRTEFVRSTILQHMVAFSSESEVGTATTEEIDAYRLSNAQTRAVMQLTAPERDAGDADEDTVANKTALSLSVEWEVVRVATKDGEKELILRRRKGWKARHDMLHVRVKDVSGRSITYPQGIVDIVDDSIGNQVPPPICRQTPLLTEGHSVLRVYNLPDGVNLTVRFRQDGDVFAPTWKSRGMKVKDFLREMKVPLSLRDSIPVVTRSDSAEIISIPPHVGYGYTNPHDGVNTEGFVFSIVLVT